MKIFAPLLVLIPLFGFGQKQAFVINGKIQGLPNGVMMFLTDANSPTDTLSRDSVKNGIFKLTGTINEPNLYYLNFGSSKKDLLFIGNDEINISGNIEDIKNLAVTGSPSNADFD